MQTIEYRHVDKGTWGAGPWQSEPDKKQWQDEATGLPCLMVRNPMGSLCGYVGVAEGHPLFEVDYDKVDVEIHGGITYAAPCAEGEPTAGICHRPADGEPDHVWWLGFDCAHAWDLSPAVRTRDRLRGWPDDLDETYRDQAYVEAECASLARQLAAHAAAQRAPSVLDAAGA